MKTFTLPFLSAALLAAACITPSAQAKDKHKKHHGGDRDRREVVVEHRDGDRRQVVVEHRQVIVERRDDGGDYRDNRQDYSYRSRYPRRVVVYENHPYGYNYYDLQVVLRREGYYRGPLDGVWGPGSRAALVSYQSRRGWRDDGEVDGRFVTTFNIGY